MSDCPLHHSHFDYDPNLPGPAAILRCKGCGGLWPEVLPEPGGEAMMHVATQYQDIHGLLRVEIARLRAEVERLERQQAETLTAWSQDRDDLRDRLQRAEAIAETLKVAGQALLTCIRATTGEAWQTYLAPKSAMEDMEAALAAWEEGKA